MAILSFQINQHAGKPKPSNYKRHDKLVVVDDDSNIQHLALATEETTVTQQVSHSLDLSNANPARVTKSISLCLAREVASTLPPEDAIQVQQRPTTRTRECVPLEDACLEPGTDCCCSLQELLCIPQVVPRSFTCSTLRTTFVFLVLVFSGTTQALVLYIVLRTPKKIQQPQISVLIRYGRFGPPATAITAPPCARLAVFLVRHPSYACRAHIHD